MHRPSFLENLIPRNPAPIPAPVIDLQTLDIIHTPFQVSTFARNLQCLVLSELNTHLRKPRRMDEERGLPRQWIQPDHVPQLPGLHRTCVAVPGDTA